MWGTGLAKNQKIDLIYKRNFYKYGQHEFGHYIAARTLGFETNGVTFTITGIPEGHSGECVITLSKKLTSIEDTVEYIENRIIILYAGSLAESISIGNDKKVDHAYARKELLEGGAVNDHAKVRELLRILHNLTSSTELHKEATRKQELNDISDELWIRAVKIVEKEWHIIEGMGERLVEGVKTSYEPFHLSAEDINEARFIKDRFGE